MNAKRILKTLTLSLILFAKLVDPTDAIIKIVENPLAVEFLIGSSAKARVIDIYLSAVVHGITIVLNDSIDIIHNLI